MEPIFLEPDGGEVVSDSDERWVVIKAGLEQVTVTESRYAVGERGPEPHVHRKHATPSTSSRAPSCSAWDPA